MGRQIIKLIVFICSQLLISGCANIFSFKSPQLNLHIQAASYLNPNIYRKASPVVLVIYQLRSAAAFKQSNFLALYSTAEKTLGNDLIDKREFEIKPQQKMTAKQSLMPNTHYIGILAAFRNTDKAQWKKIVQLPTEGKNICINIQLATQNITTRLVD